MLQNRFRPGVSILARLVSGVQGFCGLTWKAKRMGTKPMVFPLDADGRIYVLHNENDEPVCTGSRETCYRLMEIMLEVKRRADEYELKTAQSAEVVAMVAGATASS